LQLVFGRSSEAGRLTCQREVAEAIPMADKKKMSVAEIMAAARAQKAGTQSQGVSPAADAESTAADAATIQDSTAPESAAAKPDPKPAAKPGAKAATAAGGRPSVAEIMALARSKAAAGATESAPKPTAPKAAPVAKPAAEKPAAKTAAKPAAKPAVARDTASILAAARAGAKPGPVSKADAPPRPEVKKQVPEKPAAERAPVKLAAAAVPAKPVKPAAKKGAEADEDRRGFLEIALGSFMAMGFTALSVTGGLFSLGLARYFFPNVLAEPPSRFKVGFKEGFPVGKVETKFVAQYGVWVVNSDVGGQQQVYALKTVCTHLGCTPNWLEAEQKFKCPCHGSGLYKDGVNFAGPAPRPLERYAIRLSDDGQLEVDKSRTFQEELGQWADPESFITV
jgi:cytochrome b6-f complex iron-sulfur subunit